MVFKVIPIIHSSGTGLRADAKRWTRLWPSDRPGTVSLRACLAAHCPACQPCRIVQVTLSSPWPQAENPGSSQLPPLRGLQKRMRARCRVVLARGGCGALTTHGGISKEMKWPARGGPGRLPRGGGIGTQQDGLGSERRTSLNKGGLTSRASLSPGEGSGALPSV